jgi:6-pyruvoyltetrahydropterin/6-carboxytetrahydropterin synthase
VDGPTSAENLARFLYEFARGLWPEVAAVRVSETPKTWAEYRPEA